jgi:hypothetical protein
MDYINIDKEQHSLISIDRKEKEDLTISMKEACGLKRSYKIGKLLISNGLHVLMIFISCRNPSKVDRYCQRMPP